MLGLVLGLGVLGLGVLAGLGVYPPDVSIGVPAPLYVPVLGLGVLAGLGVYPPDVSIGVPAPLYVPPPPSMLGA